MTYGAGLRSVGSGLRLGVVHRLGRVVAGGTDGGDRSESPVDDLVPGLRIEVPHECAERGARERRHEGRALRVTLGADAEISREAQLVEALRHRVEAVDRVGLRKIV